ncbi:MAG: iron-containing alcohol dehydrogenase [Gammaproteobacteria bacterium]|nr:dehydrogenase [Gammaproteobacteria bacterium]MBQ08343.1 dehydrogenase [Gammaproteobacteria bacterium]MDP6146216.1 iron-containing alcohol dehydrogenase [Gammaproteobacteria bacterium]HJL80843.1 iron-containing alcohol dehydrogenase [Gammaproteobacteria bacterium]HJN01005.1 iron-containing alcohol dehydrogenase [Gammaproteobacteria bacterium]
MKNLAINDSNILEPQDWTFPIPIAYGPGRINEIGSICDSLNIKNPLIVTDKNSKERSFIECLMKLLNQANIKADVFAGISPNPRDDEISNGSMTYKSGGHDAVIAIGGGSAMDGAKAIGLTANNDIPLWDFEWEKEPAIIGKENRFPKLICIPTTAGTGAETEGTAMVTDVEKGMKFCICHPELKPSMAILDPELTLGLPQSLTAWTGADAMIHSIEAYCVPSFHPLCDGAALQSLSLISKNLVLAVEEPNNLHARGGMLVASCLGGIAFLKGLGLVHAISHMIGAEFDTHHGLTNAIVLPVITRFNFPGLEAKVERMSSAMQYKDGSVDSFISNIDGILDRIEIPNNLEEIGVPMDCVERISEKAMKDSAFATNPRIASLEEMNRLVSKSIKHAR